MAGVSPAKPKRTQPTRLPLQKSFKSDAGTHRTPKALRAKSIANVPATLTDEGAALGVPSGAGWAGAWE